MNGTPRNLDLGRASLYNLSLVNERGLEILFAVVIAIAVVAIVALLMILAIRVGMR